GIPLGNIQSGFGYLENYKSELSALTFPNDSASVAPYPFYDRWTDSFNVTTEFVHTDQARSLASLAFLAALTPTKNQSWVSGTGQIVAPATGPLNAARTATLVVPGFNLEGARI